MNKKILLFGILGLFAVALVTAGVLTYYGQIHQDIDVKSPITVSPDTFMLIEGWAGFVGVVEGEPVTIENIAPMEVEVKISNDNMEPNIDVSYVGTLELTKKDTSTWDVLGDKITITYTVVGETFEVIGVPLGYTAIYYKDGIVGLDGRLENPQPAISIVGIGNLPESDDFNMDETANYCAEPDFYNQCRGAKLWVVLTEDITWNTEGTEGTLAWGNWDSFYFETDLIQFNTEGNIVMSPGSSLTITPIYDIDSTYIGTTTITTLVEPVA